MYCQLVTIQFSLICGWVVWWVRYPMLGRPCIDAGFDEDGKTLANWRWIEIYVKGWKIGKILADKSSIGRLGMDWQIGEGLALNWQIGKVLVLDLHFGNRLADWSRFCRLVIYWHCIGIWLILNVGDVWRLLLAWKIGWGLLKWSCIERLVQDWQWIAGLVISDGMTIYWRLDAVLTDLSRIGFGLEDQSRIGIGLTMNWQIGLELQNWSGIGRVLRIGCVCSEIDCLNRAPSRHFGRSP